MPSCKGGENKVLKVGLTERKLYLQVHRMAGADLGVSWAFRQLRAPPWPGSVAT